jgi:two-component system chemotaxis response regulator CheB
MSRRNRDVIVVGASAGGVEALRSFVGGLPPDLPASILVVLHLPPGGNSALASILSRTGPLPAVVAQSDMPLVNGRIQVAPPDHHLLLRDGHAVLSHGPTENGHRPSINALFRSAAVAAGPAVTGVQLSGALDDGVAGLASISARGGVVMVQDPADALYPSMPEHALRQVDADFVLAAADMGETLAKIAQAAVDLDAAPQPSRLLALENQITMNPRSGRPVEEEPSLLGVQSGYTCPDCQGTLARVEPTRFRCRIGHAWTADALLEAQGSDWERALSAALRTLDEKTTLGRRMADHARQGGNDRLVARYERIAEEASAAAAVLRDHLGNGLPTRSEKGSG